MEVIYGIIPGMLVLGLLMVGVFFWAARTGQFDDMEGDAQRILMDEDLSPASENPGESAEESFPEADNSATDPATDSPDPNAY